MRAAAGIAIALGLVAAGCGARAVTDPANTTTALTVATHATVYVSPSGVDGASGHSPAHPWRTLDRAVQGAAPGTLVRLEGGGVWHEPLDVQRSGLPGRPIVFTTYGRGVPRLDGGIYLRSASWLVFRRIAIGHTKQGVLGSAAGNGSTHIVVDRLHISHVSIGINAANPHDSNWTIERTRIADTGDSGIILLAASSVVRDSTIERTGRSGTISYGKHAIYAKGPRQTVTDNHISGFSANGISVRYPGALVAGNTIDGGPVGVAFFDDAHDKGTVAITGNHISGVTSSGIYVDGSRSTAFVIARNSIAVQAGSGLELHEVPRLTVVHNTVRGTSTYDLAAQPPHDAYSEHDNRWLASASHGTVSWDGCALSLAGYTASTGEGEDDVVPAGETGGSQPC